MMKALRVPDYLGHMLDAIERIKSYTAQMTMAAFLENPLVQDAVIRNLEIIGEASNNIQRNDPNFAASHPSIPWATMYMMRNRLAHGYNQVDMEVVWATIVSDLPVLSGHLRPLAEILRLSDDGSAG